MNSLRNWRVKLAAVGGVIWLTAIFGTLPVLLREPATLVRAEATRSHSHSQFQVLQGFCGAISTSSWTEERWSFQAPVKIVAGSSGSLRVQAEIVDHEMTISGPVGDAGPLPYCPNDHQTTKPDYIKEPVTISVSGPFNWGGEQEQTTPPNHPNPLEWSWVLTSDEPGGKIIQIELPARSDESRIRTKRTYEVRDESNNPSSRFIQIPVKVASVGLVTPRVESILVLLGWLVGPAFSAPWLVWLVRRLLKSN